MNAQHEAPAEDSPRIRIPYDELAAAFQALVDNYVAKKYPRKTADASSAF